MVPFNESRRHRLNPNETPLVRTLVLEKLRQLLDERLEPDVAEELFRVAWRIDNNAVGKPSYPQFDWVTLSEWLSVHEGRE